MPVTVYRSDDAGAPDGVSNAASSLLAVLDACLVTGYGSKDPAGWAIAFTETNRRAYRAAVGNRFYVQINDSASQVAYCTAWESMTDMDTGANSCPDGDSVYFYKSNGSTKRPWVVIASETFCYIWIGVTLTHPTLTGSASYQLLNAFGDFPSNLDGDDYNFFLMGNYGSSTTWNLSAFFSLAATGSTTQGHYVMRPSTQVAGAIAVGKSALGFSGQDSGARAGAGAYPSVLNGGMVLVPAMIVDDATGIRGRIPGMWAILHSSLPGDNLDTFTGSGALAGKSFILLDVCNGGARGRVAIETSNTW